MKLSILGSQMFSLNMSSPRLKLDINTDVGYSVVFAHSDNLVVGTLNTACFTGKSLYFYRDVLLIPGDSNIFVLKYLVNQFSMNFTSDVSVYTAVGD
jgi:hypothetical protein